MGSQPKPNSIYRYGSGEPNLSYSVAPLSVKGNKACEHGVGKWVAVVFFMLLSFSFNKRYHYHLTTCGGYSLFVHADYELLAASSKHCFMH